MSNDIADKFVETYRITFLCIIECLESKDNSNFITINRILDDIEELKVLKGQLSAKDKSKALELLFPYIMTAIETLSRIDFKELNNAELFLLNKEIELRSLIM